MTIILNGTATEVADDMKLEQLLKEHGYAERKVAVAVNESFVPRGQYASTILNPGDDIEIVAPMPGG